MSTGIAGIAVYVFIYKPTFVTHPNLGLVHVTDDPEDRPAIFRPENPDEMMIWLMPLQPDGVTVQVFLDVAGIISDSEEDRISREAARRAREYLARRNNNNKIS